MLKYSKLDLIHRILFSGPMISTVFMCIFFFLKIPNNRSYIFRYCRRMELLVRWEQSLFLSSMFSQGYLIHFEMSSIQATDLPEY